MIPAKEIWERIARMRKASEPECMLIFQNVDRYYFSGTLMGSYILLPHDSEPQLFCRKGCMRAERESPLKVKQGGLSTLKDIGDFKTIGVELDVLPASIFIYLEKIFPNSQFKDVSGTIRKLRSVKSEYEMARIKKAARIADVGMGHAREIVKPGMREIDLAASIEKRMREEGHQGLVRHRAFGQELFYGHILTGRNGATQSFIDSPTGGQGLSTAMPQGAGFKRIRKNESVLVDYVGVWEGYIADESRIFVCGKLPSSLNEALHASHEIQGWIGRNLCAGTIPSEIYYQAIELANEWGLGKNFLGMREKIKFVGHGVGLELDELPVLAQGYTEPLKKYMTVASEPKFIFSSGVAGVEDTFLVEENGGKKLTRFVS